MQEGPRAGKNSIDELAGVLTAPFTHLELGQVNDHAVYVMHVKGEFPFHRHVKDEMYVVLEGQIVLRFRNRAPVTLNQRETMVVPAYTTHSAESSEGALILVVKPKQMFGSVEHHD